MVQVTTKDGYILGVQRIPWGGLIRRQQIGHQSQHQWLNSLTKPIQKAGTEPFFGFGGPRPPSPPNFGKKKGSIYITYRFEQFCPYKIRLAPLNKIFDPFKQNEKAQETFTNLKSQTKQISKPKKNSPTT